MKVSKRWDKNDKEFHQLVEGDVFEVNNKTYMKLAHFNTMNNNFNAVELTTAKFAYMQSTFKVEHFPDAELKLK